MSAAKIETGPVTGAKPAFAFFRQSGWLMIATVVGGLLMLAVHTIAQRMPKAEYGVFTTLIQIVTLMGIPAAGLQSIFAQQAAESMNPGHERELSSVCRGVLRGIFFIWLSMAAGVFVFHNQILAALKISNPVALWLTVLVGLVALWRPVLQGILQGRQNFPWLGGIMISEGAGRFGAVCVVVGLLGCYAAGAMLAVLLGMVAVMAVGGWLCRDCLRGEKLPMRWGPWLRRVVPLTLGMGVGIFMLAADMLFVQWFFPKEQTGYYAAAGMIGRALVYFTTPVAAVMFPKLARSKALGEKTNALALALGLTALAGAGAAVMCSLFPALPLQVARYSASYLEISAPLVPWFAWCMLPLTLAMVLLNSLMARSQFRAVPWLVLVAAGYGVTLYLRHETFIQVIQTLGCFAVLLLAVCVWFTYHGQPVESEITPPGA